MPGLSIARSLNKAYKQLPVDKSDFEIFKEQLRIFYEQIERVDTEEKVKGDLMDFLKRTFYGYDYKVSPNGKIDCAIHLGSGIDAPVGVICEVKMPSNTSEMVTRGDLNRKAMQELLLYWLRERVGKKNIQLKKLIATNIYEFFIFDAQEFERVFYSNKRLLRRYEEFNSGSLTSEKTDFFYKEIASECIASVADDIEYVWFDIRKYKPFLSGGEDRKLIDLYKVFSPENLLKKQFQTDSNKLNTKFYSELLHIIGLEEVEDKDSHKRIITRRKPGDRNPASILEDAMTILDAEDWLDRVPRLSSYGADREDRMFNVALSLSICWVNRVLFLKLLEAQLIKYHKGDRSYSFLNPSMIPDYDELNKLFFQVLAKRPEDRQANVSSKYSKIPYLNSSLFEMSQLESETIRVSNLSGGELPLCVGSVMKEVRGGRLPALRYLLEFLDSYDFSGDGSDEVCDNAKTLISASVLGLIFEKINGHRDGSVFTPGAVTMYISKETVRRAVVRKFNDAMGWSCRDYDELKDRDLDDLRKANEIVDSLKVCDPSVGSGHFLVSALNEIIRTKYDLGILLDRDGRRIKKQDYCIEIENDELMVSDADGEPFVYIPGNPECQRVQEALFSEKRRVIENCLFGVDINPNAVNICRLRLWIELLKNAFYTKESGYTELETLPNIDINIKVGNSLLHRYDITQDISEILHDSGISINEYKAAVSDYKNAHTKELKRSLERMILQIKSGLHTQMGVNDPKLLRLNKLKGELHNLKAPQLFEASKKEQAQYDKKIKDLKSRISRLQDEVDAIRDNRLFVDAFEWRIEFPEVLDEYGRFVGFDCIVGNPPYIQLQKMGEAADALAKMEYATYERTGDIYCLFYELGWQLLRPSGLLCFITSNKWMRAGYGENTRSFLSDKTNPRLLVDFSGVKVFDSATVDTNILLFEKSPNTHDTLCAVTSSQPRDVINNLGVYVQQQGTTCGFSGPAAWVVLTPIEQSIKRKIESVGKPLRDWDISINYGIKTGYNDAFIITTERRDEILSNCKSEEERQRTESIIRPILRGRDIKRYSYDWAGLWLIWIPWHFPLHLDSSIQGSSAEAEQAFMNQYPSVYQHLLLYKPQLSARNKAETGIRYEWYALQRWGANYSDDFSQPKIMYPNMTKFIPFYYDEKGFYQNDKSFMITGNHLAYLTAFLNSSLFKFCFLDNFPELQGGTRELRKIFFDKIPVLNVSDDVNDEFKVLVNEIQTKYSKEKAIAIDNMLFDLYDLTKAERDAIGFIEIK